MRECEDNFVYLLQKEPEFKNRFFSSKELCMKHFNGILPLVKDTALFDKLLKHQIETLDKTKNEIDTFCNKFDYRNTSLDIEKIKKSPAKAVGKLRSLVDNGDMK